MAPAVFNTVGGNPAVGAVGSTPSRSRQTFVPHGVCLYAPSLAPPPASAESRLTVADLGKKVLLPHKPCPIQADKFGHVSLKSGRPNPLKPDTLCMGAWRKGPNRFGRFLQRVIGANACYFRAHVVQNRNTEPEIMKCLWKMNRRRSGP